MRGILGVLQGKLDVNIPSESYREKRVEKVDLGLANVIHAAYIKDLLKMVP